MGPFWGVAVMLVALGQPAGEKPAASTISTKVELKQIESAVVAYVEHDGPEWAVGKVFDRIDAVMTQTAQEGPMFCEYPSDAKQAQPRGTTIVAGFFIDGVVSLPDGFRQRRVPEHSAAVLTVSVRYGMTSPFHTELRRWASANGYTPAGGVVEVYPQRSGGQSVIEIRLPVVSADQTVPAPERVTESFETLAAAGRFADAAVSVIPEWVLSTSEHRKWVLDVADRLRAIRSVVDKKYATGKEPVLNLVSPILKRVGRLSLGDTAETAAVARDVSFSARNASSIKAKVLRDLDRIMVGTHLRTLESQDVFDQLVSVLGTVRLVLRPVPATVERSGAGEGGGDADGRSR